VKLPPVWGREWRMEKKRRSIEERGTLVPAESPYPECKSGEGIVVEKNGERQTGLGEEVSPAVRVRGAPRSRLQVRSYL